MNAVLDDLLNRWEESCDQGQPLSPEQLCRDHPELLDELKWQIRALQEVNARYGEGHTPTKLATSQQFSRTDETVQVSTDFRIDRLHATGGLGEVYLANDPLLQRTVAIKFPRRDRLSSEQLARFQREARVTGRLNHPGIVPVHALRQDNAYEPCYVMQFVDGPTLQEQIEKLYQQPQSTTSDFYWSLEFRQLLQSFVSLCNIVAYAHDQGIVHRDIKPANVILGPFGETFLMDWGLAKIVSEAETSIESTTTSRSADTVAERDVRTRTGQFMGTPAYASPEQLSGRLDLIDGRTDIYSLGATLATIVTGKVPTEDMARSVPLKNSSGSLVPRRLEAICRKAWSTAIEDRYSSTASLRADVERYLAGEPISVIAETLWSRLTRTVRKRSGWAAAILVGVCTTIVAASIGSVLLSQKNQELQKSNKHLEDATSTALAAQKRSDATTQLLTRAMQAATPEIAQGNEPTIRQLLDATSLQLTTDDSILPLVAADTHKVLANAYLSLGVYDAAQQHADECLEIYREVSGQNSAETLDAQALAALLLSRRGEHKEAMRIAKDAFERGRTVQDVDAATLVTLMDGYAHVCSKSPNPNHKEIVALHSDAYELARHSLGSEHPTTLRSRTNLGVALMDSGQLQAGEQILRETKDDHERLLGKIHPETLVDVFNLIASLFKRDQFQAAAKLAREYRTIFEQVFGADHERNIRMSLLMGQIEFRLGNVPGAEQEARLGLERADRTLGPVHARTLEARGMLCSALLAQGKAKEANELANLQYDKAEDAFGDSHPHTIQAATLLFDIAEANEDVEAMTKWLDKLRGSPWESPASDALQRMKAKKSAK